MFSLHKENIAIVWAVWEGEVTQHGLLVLYPEQSTDELILELY